VSTSSPAPPGVAFDVRRVTKTFLADNQVVTALAETSFTVPAGSFTCIVGPSGCGKSTLLRILGGLETPTTGSVRTAAGGAAFVFQEHGVFPWFTVEENVAFGARMEGMGRAERRELARHWLAQVGLADFAQAYPHQLSGGMRQRVAIARAFATGWPALLMDEPLGALDAQTRMLMQELLLTLWEAERKTVVLVTHAIEEALLLGDRVLIMTARPGHLKEDIEVPFPRPRSSQIEATAAFAEMRGRIWASLRDEVSAAAVAP